MPPRFEPDKILGLLLDRQVVFVMIGGLAAVAYGSPIVTGDVDVTPERSAENLSRLSAALIDLDAHIRFDDESVPFRHDAQSLANAGVWNLRTKYGDLDISMAPNGTAGYEDLARDMEQVDVLGVIVPAASLADVIRSKQAANRPKDQRVLPVLREILASRHHREPPPEERDRR